MRKNQEFLPTMSSGDVGRMMVEVARRELKGWSDKGLLIRVYGVLMNLEAQRAYSKSRGWNTVYGVVLDAEGPLAINASREVFEGCDDGDMVEIVGYPTIKVIRGELKVQLDVLHLRHPESEDDQNRRKVVQSNLAALKAFKPVRNVFPLQSRLSVDVIYSGASAAQVDEDFYNGLGEAAGRCQIRPVPIRITSASEVAEAIRSSHADILIIIRGGGEDVDFAVFNNAEVLSALSEAKAYRVTGIGHSGNSTLADLIADFSAAVPAQAGSHIREQLCQVNKLLGEYEGLVKKQMSEIIELSEEVESVSNDSRAEINRLHEIIKIKSSHTKNIKTLWAVIAILLLVLIIK